MSSSLLVLATKFANALRRAGGPGPTQPVNAKPKALPGYAKYLLKRKTAAHAAELRKKAAARKTTDLDFGGAKVRTRVNLRDPLISGEMQPVTSSNVHSVGFLLDPDAFPDARESRGQLLVRYLASGSHGKKPGGGPTYAYRDVPVSLFRALLRAASKGEWVWGELRQRGTISGHKFAYELVAVSGNYVPRQAGLKRGEAGEFYLTRKFRDAEGNLLQSQLQERRVKSSGPNRGAPNRGTPNRGTSRR